MNDLPRPKRAVVVIPEASGKRIRELRIEEPYAESHEFYATICFEDETEILLDLTAQLQFAVLYLHRVEGELEPIKQYPKQLLRTHYENTN